jgi:BirA family biotin operon repressor/biotin-[acetyl-CoA-carboxylase] ligase
VPSATSLALQASDAALRGPLSRTEVVRSCLTALGELYLSWQGRETDEELAASYRARCSTIGRLVRVELVRGPPMEGTATGVDAGGRLVVRTDTGVQIVGAGDVIHLRSV